MGTNLDKIAATNLYSSRVQPDTVRVLLVEPAMHNSVGLFSCLGLESIYSSPIGPSLVDIQTSLHGAPAKHLLLKNIWQKNTWNLSTLKLINCCNCKAHYNATIYQPLVAQTHVVKLQIKQINLIANLIAEIKGVSFCPGQPHKNAQGSFPATALVLLLYGVLSMAIA